VEIILTAATDGGSLVIPIEIIFWGFVAAYVIHILEESVVGEVFVEKVKKKFWAEYNWTKFFGFNTLLMSLNIISIVLFDIMRGGWLIFPLALAFERIFNGFWHLGETIITKKYSSGLLASVLTWILGYFIIRYSLLKGEIPAVYFIISVTIGLLMTCVMLWMIFHPPGAKKLKS
jgi:hypothetical protein